MHLTVKPVFNQSNRLENPINPCTYNGELTQGAEYINGQYTYKYMQEMHYSEWIDISNDGWGVALTEKESTDPVITKQEKVYSYASIL